MKCFVTSIAAVFVFCFALGGSVAVAQPPQYMVDMEEAMDAAIVELQAYELSVLDYEYEEAAAWNLHAQIWAINSTVAAEFAADINAVWDVDGCGLGFTYFTFASDYRDESIAAYEAQNYSTAQQKAILAITDFNESAYQFSVSTTINNGRTVDFVAIITAMSIWLDENQ